MRIITSTNKMTAKLRPAGMNDDEYMRWWIAHQNVVAAHAARAAYTESPERIGRIVAGVGSRVEQLSRDLARKFPMSSPFYREPWADDWRGIDLAASKRAENEGLRRELQRRIKLAVSGRKRS